MTTMPSHFDPKPCEDHWSKKWEELRVGSPKGDGQPYCIMIPPPNVTGTLHMGHGFQLTLMDVLIRYHRMMGRKTLWQVGTDHAGIATQMVVERQLAAKGESKQSIGRDAFIEHIHQWVEKSGGTITQQMRRMGASVDWEHERFTLDETLSRSVKTVFIELYEQGLIYQGHRLVNWDPVLKTALSDLEVTHSEQKGSLWHIFYPLSDDPQKGLTVATTRPETLLGDVAVAVHPEDKRYQSWIGKTLMLPLCNREIPIIADQYVDPDFGSGCVKITPAHDFNDHAIGKRHNLIPINIFNDDASLNEQAPKAYQGMDRLDARKKIIADLDGLSLLMKTEEHQNKLPIGDRSGAILEPRITQQWFMKMEGLANNALQAAERGDVNFTPENWINTYRHWLDNIEDWCISRQLWWGHRIPAWYDEKGNVYVGEDESSIRAKYNLGDCPLSQDEDVLDTWFSSALWPFSTLGWPEENERLATFYPTQVLVTGFDILFFWVARMIMMGQHCTGQLPFSDVYITGLIRDQFGQKMSKSKGNVIDPIDLIDGIDLESLLAKRTQGLMQPEMKNAIAQKTKKEFPQGIAAHGTDAVRFTFCALASTGRDINFDKDRLMGYRNFCNKLWNATRYTLMQLDGLSTPIKAELSSHPTHRWMITRLQHAIKETHQHLEHYRFDHLSQTLYELVWHDFCDWYLELTKPLLNEHKDDLSHAYTLAWVLDQILRLLHPIMPFITESLWERIHTYLSDQSEPALALTAFATTDDSLIFPEESAAIEWLKALIIEVRTLRSEMNIRPNQGITLVLTDATEQDLTLLEAYQPYLQHFAKVEHIEKPVNDQALPPSASIISGTLQCAIPLAGLIDPEDELKRVERNLKKQQKEADSIAGRLKNPTYCEKAPQHVVAEQQALMESFLTNIEKYNKHKTMLQALMEK